jgi:hypothetical protein
MRVENLLFITIFALIFLSRFGLSLSDDFSLSFSYITLFLFLGVGLLKGLLMIPATRVIVYILTMLVLTISWMLGISSKSSGSLFLILFLYLPYCFQYKIDSNIYEEAIDFLKKCLLVLGMIGIFQYFVQFIYSPAWLFDFKNFIPDVISMKGVMNTVIPIGGHFKSNGFFLNEPSGFSQFMAIGIILETVGARRKLPYAVYILGLLVSFSGTGIMLLGFSLLFPLGLQTIKRVIVVAIVGSLIFILLGKPLGLDQTVDRTSEFSAEKGKRTSSAGARFIMPFYVVGEGFSESAERVIFGHGPGTISRLKLDYEFHDPTWAKLLYEYGVAGFIAMTSFLTIAFFRTPAPAMLIAGLCFEWLILGGHLLNPSAQIMPLVCLSLMSRPVKVRPPLAA